MIAPQFDPVAIQIGFLSIHWYGLMYLVGFAVAYVLARHRRHQFGQDWSLDEINDLIIYGAFGVLLGGRLGYVVFYDLGEIAADPFRILRIWEGGMSFHGGLLGVILAMILFAKKSYKGFYQVTDFIAPLVPIGLGVGRIGNFINGELWGRVSDVPWAMSPYPGALPRHPSQLYEALLEGLVFFIILWWFSSSMKPRRAVSGLFLIGYGGFRFIVEFFRAPDEHIGFIAFDWMTMGQLLCLPMVAFGVWLMVVAYQNREEHL